MVGSQNIFGRYSLSCNLSYLRYDSLAIRTSILYRSVLWAKSKTPRVWCYYSPWNYSRNDLCNTFDTNNCYERAQKMAVSFIIGISSIICRGLPRIGWESTMANWVAINSWSRNYCWFILSKSCISKTVQKIWRIAYVTIWYKWPYDINGTPKGCVGSNCTNSNFFLIF